eukprot:6188543-Pleurochrysis_carterae.AAC.4
MRGRAGSKTRNAPFQETWHAAGSSCCSRSAEASAHRPSACDTYACAVPVECLVPHAKPFGTLVRTEGRGGPSLCRLPPGLRRGGGRAARAARHARAAARPRQRRGRQPHSTRLQRLKLLWIQVATDIQDAAATQALFRPLICSALSGRNACLLRHTHKVKCTIAAESAEVTQIRLQSDFAHNT